jgi:ATP-dependent Clp protease ATP-binding subunit ClpX
MTTDGQVVQPEDLRDGTPRSLEEIRPSFVFDELRRGVLGQDDALRFVSVAVYKHTSGRVSGNILLIGNSGTGKTTIMNNVQRLYDTVPEYEPFRVMTILNANLLVDSDRTEFRPDRIFTAVEQRARLLLGEKPGPEELRQAIERATICIDEIDKMTSIVLDKANPIGVVLQQGLLTLMEGERVPYRTRAWVDGEEKQVVLEIDTERMMFVCGGAFEGLYDKVYLRVTKKGSGQRLKAEAIRTADGQVRLEQRFSLAKYMKMTDLYAYGMVPQFMSRFDKVVLLRDLSVEVLKQILLKSWDSPFQRSKRFFETMNIDLEIEDLAAALIAEKASMESRTGARALRDIFLEIVNPLEFDPWSGGELESIGEGRWRLLLDADSVRESLRRRGR